MIKYYCDKCNKELQNKPFVNNRMFTLTITSDNAIYKKLHICTECKQQVLKLFEKEEGK